MQTLTAQDWQCPRHAKQLTPHTPQRTTVFTLTARRPSRRNRPPTSRLIWAENGTPLAWASSGITPGFYADPEALPPGTRLVVTARIELPGQKEESA